VLERPIHDKDFDPEWLDSLKLRWIARLKLPRALGGVAAWGHPKRPWDYPLTMINNHRHQLLSDAESICQS